MQRIDNTLSWPFDAYRCVLFHSVFFFFLFRFVLTVPSILPNTKCVNNTHWNLFYVYFFFFLFFFSPLISFVCTNTHSHTNWHTYIWWFYLLLFATKYNNKHFCVRANTMSIVEKKKNYYFLLSIKSLTHRHCMASIHFIVHNPFACIQKSNQMLGNTECLASFGFFFFLSWMHACVYWELCVAILTRMILLSMWKMHEHFVETVYWCWIFSLILFRSFFLFLSLSCSRIHNPARSRAWFSL